MVKLTELLISIIEDRKSTISGEDIKHITEAIQISESMEKVEKDKDQKTPEQILKDWMGD